MKLKDWSPIKNASWVNKTTQRHLEKNVKREYSEFTYRKHIEELEGIKLPDDNDDGWFMYLDSLNNTTFTHQNLYSFVELEDGTLVGFNENPSHGWSFPVGKWKSKTQK